MTSGRIGYKNGRYVPEEQLTTHIYTAGSMFGSGCFEMSRTFNHKHFLFDEHIKRLFNSMRSFHIPIDKTKDDLLAICDELMKLNAQHFVNDEYRFMINVDSGPLPIYREVFELEDEEDWNKPNWIVNAWPLSKTAKTLAKFYRTGANAVVVSQRQIPSQFLDPKVKSRSRAHLMLANVEASKHGPLAQALLLDETGCIAEGSGANFLIVKDSDIISPKPKNILRGCSMQYIKDVICAQTGLTFIEQDIEPYDVLAADEAFFTGTFTNLIPCNRLNGQFLKGRPQFMGNAIQNPMGPITKFICDRWSQNVGLDFISQCLDWDAEDAVWPKGSK